jgi:hypothetical protein
MAAAWYLSKIAGASDNFVDISIPAPVEIAGAYDFTIGFEVQLTGTDLPVLHASVSDASTNFYFVNSLGNLAIRTAGNSNTITVNGGVKTDFNLYAVRHYTLAGVPKRQVFYNGELKAEYALSNIPTAPITYLFKIGNASRTGNLKTLFFTDANAPINNKTYDANLSGGIGTTLPPDGTLNGAMAWVEYDDGSAVTPISLSGAIPDISVNVGDAVNIDLNAYFDGTETPFIITSIGADLSAVGLSIAAGVIVGTATAGSLTGVRVRGTDAALNTADSNLFNVTVAETQEYELIPVAGVYSYTGAVVSIAAGRALKPDAGEYSYTGQQVPLLTSRVITPESGSFSYTGSSVALLANRLISPQAGSYSYTGRSVVIEYTGGAVSYVITPEPAVYSYAGLAVSLLADRVINPQSGSYSYNGQALALNRGYTLTPAAGNYSYQGQSVGLLVDRVLTPETGAYAYTGSALAMDYSGVVLLLIDGYQIGYASSPVAIAYAPATVQLAYKQTGVLLSYKPVSGV